MKKILTLIVVLIISVSSSSVFAEKIDTTAIGIDEDATYGVYKFDNKVLAERLSGAILMRTYNTHAYFFGYRDKIDYGSEFITPYRDDNSNIYVPVSVIAKKFGAVEEIGEDGIIKLNYNGKTIEIIVNEIPQGFNNEVQLYENRLCAKAEDVAAFLEKELFIYNELIIFSETKDIFDTSKDKSLLEELEDIMLYTWKQVNLQGGGFIVSVIQNPLDGMMYCSTDVGGAYRYEPESKMWIQLFDWVESTTPAYKPVTGIAFDPVNENIIYMTTDDGTLKSNDKGKTWSEANLPKAQDSGGIHRYCGENIIVDPNNPDVIFVGTFEEGLWRTENKTKTWQQVPSVPSTVVNSKERGVRTIFFDKTSNVINGKTQGVYVGSLGHGLYKSTDGGNTFSPVADSPKYIRRFTEWKDGWLITTELGLFYFANDEWTNVSPPEAPVKSFCALAVHPDNKNVIVISTPPAGAGVDTADQGTYFTLNGGNTWQRVNDSSLLNSRWSSCIFDPYNPEDLLYMTGRGVYRLQNMLTGDIEQIYSYKDTYGVEELCMRGVMSIPKQKENQRVLFTQYMDLGGSAHRDDYLQKDESLPSNAIGLGMDFCESDPSIIVKTDTSSWNENGPSTVRVSTDYGETWTATNWPRNEIATSVAISATKQENGFPALVVYCIYTNNVYRSGDFGDTWEKLEIEGWDKSITTNFWSQASKTVISDRVKGNEFYLANETAFFRSLDFGKTWTMRSTFTGARREMGAELGSAEKIWQPHSKGLYYSENAGLTWNAVKDFSLSDNVSFGKNYQNVSYPVIYVRGIYKGDEGVFASFDHGKTWKKLSHGIAGFGAKDTNAIAGDRNVVGRVFICHSCAGVRAGEIAGTDTRKPVITIDQTSTSENRDADFATDVQSFTISGKVNKTAEVRINNEPLPYSSDGSFEKTYTLAVGDNSFCIEAVDKNGNIAAPVYINKHYDPTYIGITVDVEETFTAKEMTGTIKGRLNKQATVYVNEEPVYPDENLNFTINYTLNKGENVLKIYATDGTYKSDIKEVHILYDSTPPSVAVDEFDMTTENNFLILTASPDEDATIRINRFTADVKAGEKISTFVPLEYGDNKVTVQGKDKVGNISQPTIFTVKSNGTVTADKTIDVEYTDNMEFTGDPEKDFGELPYIMSKLMDGNTTNVCYFGLRWNEENLYVGVKVNDNKLCADQDAVFMNDTVEVYLDGGYERAKTFDTNDVQLFFPWNGAGQSGGTTMINKDVEGGYILEIAIPWSNINTKVKAGQKVGFDIDCCDNDGEGDRNGIIGFAGTANDWSDTSEYATLVLTSKEGI